MASGSRSFVAFKQPAGEAPWLRPDSPLAFFGRLASCAALAIAVALTPTDRAPAAEYFWDPDGAASSTVGGSGTWDLTSSLWRISSVTGSLTAWPNLDADTAAFATINAPATVTIADAVTITAGSLRIGDGYLITRTGTGSLLLGGTLDGTINVTSGTVEIAAPISGSVGLTKTGSGTTLTLSGASDYTGLTTVSAGTLRVTNGSALGATGAGNEVTVSSGHQLELFGGVTVTGKTLTINGAGNNQGALQGLAGDNTWAGDVVLGSNTTRVGAAEGSILRITGAISGANPFIIRSYDTGGLSTAIVEVSGVSSYTGATQIFAGTLRLAGSDNRLPIGTTVTLGVNTISGALDLGGVNQTVASIGTSGTGSQNRIGNSSTAADSTLTVAAGTSTVTYGGGIVDTIGSGTRKTGVAVASGTLALTGAYTYTGGTTVASGASLSLGRNANYSFDSLISGAGAVTFATGNAIISQASTFSGGATLSSGAIRLGVSSVESGGTVLSGPVGTGTFAINGGALTASDATTPRTVHNPVVFGGNFSLGSSAAEFAAPLTLAGPITLTGSRTLTVNSDVAISGAIGASSGTFGLTKNGPATLTLSGQSTYGGTTTVSAGRLLLAGGNNRLPTGASVVMSGGTLDLGSTSQTTTGSLTLSSGSLAGNSLSAGGITISGGTVSAAALTNTGTSAIAISGGGTIPSILASTSGLTKTGNNTLTLTGVNTYSGLTTVSTGTLVVGTNTALGTPGAGNDVTVANNASVWLADGVTVSGKAISLVGRGSTFDSSGALRAASGTATWAGDIALPTDVTDAPRVGAGSVTNPVSTLVVSGVVSGSNATHGFAIRTYTTGAAVVGQNGGTVVLSGSNTYAGPTAVVTGALVLAGGDNRLPAGTLLNIGNVSNVSWASADLGGTNQAIGGLRSAGTTMPVVLTNTSATASLVTIGQDVEEGHVYDGVISGNLAVTKTGSNRLQLGGANTYTGTTTLNAGTLRIGNSVGTVGAITSSGIGTGPLVLNGGTFSSSTGTARTIYNPTTLGGDVALGDTTAGFAGLLDFAAAATLTGSRTLSLASNGTFSGAVGESGGSRGLTKAGTGLLTLSGTNTYTGTTTVSAGTVSIGDGVTTGSVAGPISVATGSTIRFATAAATPQTYAGAISGDGLLEKTAAGTLTLSGTNSYAGGTSITGGAIVFDTLATIGGTGANVTVATGATAALVAGDFNTFLGRINAASTGTIALAADSSSPINLGSLPSAASLGAVGTVTYSGTLTPAAGTYRLGGLSGTLVLDQAAQITGANVLETTGNVTLAATMDHTGGTFVRAGTLALAGGDDRLPTTGAVTVSGGTLALGSTSQTVSAITLGGVAGSAATVDVGTGSLRLGGNVTYSATNNPPGATIAGGGGTLALLGNRTFTVGTTAADNRGLTVAAIIADGDATARSLTKDGTGSMVFEGNNTFTGGVTVSGGTLIVDGTNAYAGATSLTGTNTALRVRNALALGTTAGGTTVGNTSRLELAGGVTVTGETLSLAGDGGNSFGALQSQSGDNTWAGPVNLTAASSRVGGLLGTTLRISGVISGTGQLIIRPEGGTTSTAIIEFSNANTYTGGTVIYAGTLRLAGGDDRLPTGGSLTMGLLNNNLRGNVDLGGFNQIVAGLVATGSATSIPLQVIANSSTTADSTLTVNLASGTNTFGGQLNDSINGGTRKLGLTKSGAGTLVISGGTNTFTGATRLAGGTLQVGNALALQNSTVDTRTGSAGSLSFGTQTAATFGGLTGANSLALQNASALAVALTVGGNGESTTFGGILSGAGSLTKAGIGSLTLSGVNTYAGDTAVNAGTLVAGHANAFGTTGSVTIGNGAVLGVGAGVSFARPLSIPGTGRVSAGDQASVILPSVAALAAWESPSPAVAGTFADILSGSGGTAGTRTLASSWTANPGTYFSDILSLDGTGAGTTFVLSMTYSGSPDPASLNVWYRETAGDTFAPLGSTYQGVGAWTSSFTTAGQYGVDTAAGSVWVVTDHNSDFVIVPEPSAIVLCGIAAAGGLLLASRRRALPTPR